MYTCYKWDSNKLLNSLKLINKCIKKSTARIVRARISKLVSIIDKKEALPAGLKLLQWRSRRRVSKSPDLESYFSWSRPSPLLASGFSTPHPSLAWGSPSRRQRQRWIGWRMGRGRREDGMGSSGSICTGGTGLIVPGSIAILARGWGIRSPASVAPSRRHCSLRGGFLLDFYRFGSKWGWFLLWFVHWMRFLCYLLWSTLSLFSSSFYSCKWFDYENFELILVIC